MESKIQKAAAGYVRISITGQGQERFFNLCCYKHIFPSNIIYNEGRCECELLLDDYWQIEPIVRKTGVKVRLLNKCGLPFFIYKYKKRSALVISLVLACVFFVYMSLHIWSIDFTGNNYYSDEVLMDYLETIGIKNGINKMSIMCDDIESQLRIAFGNITWVSVEIDGTLLKVNIKENLNQRTVPAEDTATCDIVSEYDGTIVSIITRNGTPMVKPGDAVTKGQILISGVILLHDDSDTVTGYRYVSADGDCYIQTKQEINQRIDQSYEERKIVKENKGFFLSIGSYEETFMLPVNCSYPAQKETEINQLCLFDNFYLPVFWGRVKVDYYDSEIKFYSDELFKEYCQEIFDEELRNLEKKGVEIIENNVIIQSEDLCAYIKGELVIELKTGVAAAITLPEEAT